MSFYIYLIIVVKIIFIALAVALLFYKAKGKTEDPKAIKIEFWKMRMEFVFTILMSFLMLYLFYPRKAQQPLNYETRLLLFLFGIILLITADWTTFFHESPALTKLQSVLATSKRY